jgi:hypothetical protein
MYLLYDFIVFRLVSYHIDVEVAQKGKRVAPWGWHCFAETCRGHRKKEKEIV